MKKAPALVALTATITPPEGVPNLKRSDPSLRRQDYRDALSFYLRIPNDVLDRIVFLENSGSDLSDLESLAMKDGRGKTVEFVSFAGLDYPPTYGRAYGEFKMLDYGMRNSRLLAGLSGGEYFWKITGRLKVFNFRELIGDAPSRYNLLIDFLSDPTPMIDMRVFSCSRGGYDLLLNGLYHSLREDTRKMSAEGYCRQLWIDRLKELDIVPRHRRQPKIGGVGGQHNADYYTGINVFKYWVRAMSRRLVPGLWI